MSDYFPILFALLIVVVSFISAMNNGVVKLLASGLAALILLVVLALGIKMLPTLADQFLDIELTWKATFGISCVVAILAFTISRFILGWILKQMLGPDSWFHWLADGVPGGLVSLLPSLVIVLFLFLCTRIAGTVLEMNHVATLCQDEVAHTTTKLPDYPLVAGWKNTVDRIPFAPLFFDEVDPFSNRGHRNTALLAMIERSVALREYLVGEPETAALLEVPGLSELVQNEDVAKAITDQERVTFVTLPEVRDFAKEFPDQKALKMIEWEPFLTGFVSSLKPAGVAPTNTES